MTNKKPKCICKICNCGRHRCQLHPNRPATNSGRCCLSEYANEFVRHQQQVAAVSCRPEQKPIESGEPLSDETTNRVDFVSHPLERRRARQREEFRPKSGAFDGVSVYRREFTEKKWEPSKPTKRRDVEKGVAGEFRGDPTYRSDYIRWELPRLERSRTSPQWRPPSGKFSGTPTYKSDFVRHSNWHAVASCRPAQTAKSASAPLDDTTNYRVDFVRHPLQRRREKQLQAPLARPAAPFDAVSTFARDFTPKEARPRTSTKPDPKPVATDAPFDGATTHKEDFRQYDVERRQPRQSEEYTKPEGEFCGLTTYCKDYQPQAPRLVTAPAKERRAERLMSSGPFHDATDYRDNYLRWKTAKPMRAGPEQVYKPSSAKFTAQSTVAAHYVRHPLQPRQSCKPKENTVREEGEFDPNTLYRAEFTRKYIEPCPAALLESEKSRFKFCGVDEVGHRLYAAKEQQRESIECK